MCTCVLVCLVFVVFMLSKQTQYEQSLLHIAQKLVIQAGIIPVLEFTPIQLFDFITRSDIK